MTINCKINFPRTGAAMFNHRRRKPPLTGAFFAPVDLVDIALIQALISISEDLISIANASIPFQRCNIRSLTLKVRSFLSIFEFVGVFGGDLRLSSTVTLCFRELYILLHRSKFLLEYCSLSSRLWLILRNSEISVHFYDLNLELSTLLDVLNSVNLRLPVDLKDQVELLRSQTRNSSLFIDERDESLRLKIHEFLTNFEQGREPDNDNLRSVFVGRLGILDARICRTEIEFLEELIYSPENELDSSLLDGAVALTRYTMFLLFGFGTDVDFRKFRSFSRTFSLRGKFLQENGDGESETYVAIPKDFLCPISLDLMNDPVVVSTGQTYDRESILRWMDDGHNTCPNSGQVLSTKILVSNLALRNLISQWCLMNSVACNSPDHSDSTVAATASKAAVEANRFTTRLLVQLLSGGSEEAKTTAVRELRLLARTAKENRAQIAEAGAIPFLRELLSSESSVAQENSVTALLNLSIHDQNKSKIMDEESCLSAIVHVLIHGLTTEARENAAATLFSLSAVHNYKKRITDEDGALEALSGLLIYGTARGMKDAVTALFNLSTHPECSLRMVESGAVSALAEALETETVAEEAAGALGLLMRHEVALEAVVGNNHAVHSLVGLMRRGTPKAKENAVAALLEMCRTGGLVVKEMVAVEPTIGGLIQNLLFTGTKRARRKAASLAKLFRRRGANVDPVPYGGLPMDFPSTSVSIRRESVLAAPAGNSEQTNVTVAITVPMSVPA